MNDDATLLDARRKRHLKSRARELDPLLRLGKAGLTEGVLREIGRCFDQQELIKLRFEKTFPEDLTETLAAIEQAHGCALVQQLGRVAVFYRPRGA